MIVQNDLKLHNACERTTLVFLFSLKHYVTLGRCELSCLGPLVLLLSHSPKRPKVT
jgi:hypothetical protein